MIKKYKKKMLLLISRVARSNSFDQYYYINIYININLSMIYNDNVYNKINNN